MWLMFECGTSPGYRQPDLIGGKGFRRRAGATAASEPLADLASAPAVAAPSAVLQFSVTAE